MQLIERYITDFVQLHEMTLEKLASHLGMKSKTSLIRIKQGTAGIASLKRFEKKVLASFSLSEQEKNDLAEVVRIAQIGYSHYLAENEMRSFLKGRIPKSQTINKTFVYTQDEESPVSLEKRYENVSGMNVILINSQYTSVFETLYSLSYKSDVQITHYVYVDKNVARTIRAVNALLPLFYRVNYCGYVHYADPNQLDQTAQGIVMADILVCNYTDAGGARCEDMIIFDKPNHGRLVTRRGERTFEWVLGIETVHYVPFKRSYFGYNHFSDYIQYSRDYSKLEENREVIKIKPDISIDFISADILVKAVCEGSMPKSREFDEVLNQLYIIYAERNKNAFTKKKAAHTIMKKSAMRVFARTGKTSDHFWGMRAFTVVERISILTTLLEQVQRNPYFNLYFFRDESQIRDVEIALYSGIGILVLDSNTDYSLDRGHSEAMITHEGFIQLFRDFVLNIVIKNEVISQGETVEFLRSLLNIDLALQNYKHPV